MLSTHFSQVPPTKDVTGIFELRNWGVAELVFEVGSPTVEGGGNNVRTVLPNSRDQPHPFQTH
jgi:hypothetical protein